MSNTCFTKYALLGKREDVREAYDEIDRMAGNNDRVDIQDVIEKFDPSADSECDGYIDFLTFTLSDDNERLEFETISAWSKVEGLLYAIKHRFPSIKVYFLEEELSEGIFYTNDEDGSVFNTEYVAFFDTPEDSFKEYFSTQESMIERFCEVFEVSCSTLRECKAEIQRIQDEHEEEYFSFNYEKLMFSED